MSALGTVNEEEVRVEHIQKKGIFNISTAPTPRDKFIAFVDDLTTDTFSMTLSMVDISNIHVTLKNITCQAGVTINLLFMNATNVKVDISNIAAWFVILNIFGTSDTISLSLKNINAPLGLVTPSNTERSIDQLTQQNMLLNNTQIVMANTRAHELESTKKVNYVMEDDKDKDKDTNTV